MPDITKGHSFSSGDSCTAAKLNSLVDDAVINDDAIGADKLAANAVTNAKVSSSAAIAHSKLADLGAAGELLVGNTDKVATSVALSGDITTVSAAGLVTIADDAITTAKILDDNVTADKLANTAVTAGSYTNTSLTVDAQGRLTAASEKSRTGEVLQIVYADITGAGSEITSGTMVDVTGFTATITPTSAASTILVQCMITAGAASGNAAAYGLTEKIGSGSAVQIGSATDPGGDSRRYGLAAMGQSPGSQTLATTLLQYKASPATTSATVYQLTVSCRTNAGSHSFYLNRPSSNDDDDVSVIGASTITLTEVAG